jgi:hypothetical protein
VNKGWESGRCEEWTVAVERSLAVFIRIALMDLRDSLSKAMLRSGDRDGLRACPHLEACIGIRQVF